MSTNYSFTRNFHNHKISHVNKRICQQTMSLIETFMDREEIIENRGHRGNDLQSIKRKCQHLFNLKV